MNKHRIQTFVDDSILAQIKAKSQSENKSIASVVESVIINYFQGNQNLDVTTALNQINQKLDRLFSNQLPVTSYQLEETTQDESFEGLYYDDETVKTYAPITESEKTENTQSESSGKIAQSELTVHRFDHYFWAWESEQSVKAEIVFTSERRAKKYQKILKLLGRWQSNIIKGRPSFTPPHSKDGIPENSLVWKDDRIILTMITNAYCDKETAFKDLNRLAKYDFSLDPDKQ